MRRLLPSSAGRSGVVEAAPLPLVTARGLTKSFGQLEGLLRRRRPGTLAVDRVDLDIMPGETLALVGESGCGKSTMGRLLMRLIEPTAGSVTFDGIELMGLGRADLLKVRRRQQLMFQDPSSAFNPRMTAEALIAEPMLLAGASRAERRARVRELLPLVGLADYQATRFPHQLSGGQRQRIGIARALALRPDFIVCDEPVSALDVSVQAQVVNLLSDLQQQFGLTYLFISHDLRVVRHVATRVAVMYLGRIVEVADKQALYDGPRHPYTQALLASVPQVAPGSPRTWPMLREETEAPSMAGCMFATRCPQATFLCRNEQPVLLHAEVGHAVACHLVNIPAPASGQAGGTWENGAE